MFDQDSMDEKDSRSFLNEIDRLNGDTLAILRKIKANPFGKFNFWSDDMLMRLPEGMKPNDTIEAHKVKCQIKMTEKHRFPTYAAAENFIKICFGDYKLEEETEKHKIYKCPHGPDDDKCTGFLQLYLGLPEPIICCSYGHYGHDKNVGQPRFTGIEFAIVRLYTKIYWKENFDENGNAENISFFFKHLFDDDHRLNHVNANDLRAVAMEVGKNKLKTVRLTNGVFHERRSPTLAANLKGVKEMHEKLRDIENPLRDVVMQSKRIVKKDAADNSAEAKPPQETDGKKEKPEREPKEYELLFLAPSRGEVLSLSTEALLENIKWCNARADILLGLRMWHHLIWFAKEVKNIVYLKMVAAGDDYDEECETNRQLFLKINQAVIIAEIMMERISKMYLMIEKAPQSEYIDDFTVNLNNPAMRNIYHPVHRPYLGVRTEAEETGFVIPLLAGKAKEALGNDIKFNYQRIKLNELPYITHRILIRELDEVKEEKLSDCQKDHYRHAGATLPTLRDRESRTMMNHYENNDNVWSTTLPLFTSCSTLRFLWATGIDLREKLIEFRAMELTAWKKHHKEKLRRWDWLFGRLERTRMDSEVKLEEIRRTQKLEADALQRKKKNKNKKELKAKNAAEAKQRKTDEKRRNTPLRHYDGK